MQLCRTLVLRNSESERGSHSLTRLVLLVRKSVIHQQMESNGLCYSRSGMSVEDSAKVHKQYPHIYKYDFLNTVLRLNPIKMLHICIILSAVLCTMRHCLTVYPQRLQRHLENLFVAPTLQLKRSQLNVTVSFGLMTVTELVECENVGKNIAGE
jgi:hypothetical protein